MFLMTSLSPPNYSYFAIKFYFLSNMDGWTIEMPMHYYSQLSMLPEAIDRAELNSRTGIRILDCVAASQCHSVTASRCQSVSAFKLDLLLLKNNLHFSVSWVSSEGPLVTTCLTFEEFIADPLSLSLSLPDTHTHTLTLTRQLNVCSSHYLY